MDNNLNVAQEDQVVTVELTVKEAMAMSGYRFYSTRQLAGARSKVRKALDDKLIGEHDANHDSLSH
ncbi:MAG: hypothetical protein K0R57_2180 [Paenibacillaceae bacterium]|nr:hypothetical protein [Paenibacillaceae bacterium]